MTVSSRLSHSLDVEKTMLRFLKQMFLLSLVIAGVLAASPARADVILYNNWQSQAGQQQFQGAGNWFAQSFKTGTSAANLNTVSVMVRNESGFQGSIGVEIYSSTAGNLPNASVYTVSAATAIPSFYDSNAGDLPTGVKESFFHNLDFNLAANTQYFVVVKNLGSANIGIKYPNVAPVTDVSPTPTYYDLITNNSGSSWSNGAPTTGGYGAYVTATAAVPEPPAAVLCGIGGLGAAFLVRRRRLGMSDRQ
jgi:hypothetical protein